MDIINPKNQYEALKPATMNLVEKAKALQVVSDETYVMGCEIGKNIQNGIKIVKDKFSDSKKKASEAHKAICKLESELLDPLEDAKIIISKKTGTYKADQDRKAREEAEKILAEQKKQEEEKALKLAIKAERSGNEAKVDEILENATQANSVRIAPIIESVAKQKDTQDRVYWKYQIVDINKIDRKYLIPNDKLIASIVSAMKDKTDIEGIRVFPEYKTTFKSTI